jgi:hypothetical protein
MRADVAHAAKRPSVFGPVLLSALRRLASICRDVVMGTHFPNRLRFEILAFDYGRAEGNSHLPEEDEPAATVSER